MKMQRGQLGLKRRVRTFCLNCLLRGVELGSSWTFSHSKSNLHLGGKGVAYLGENLPFVTDSCLIQKRVHPGHFLTVKLYTSEVHCLAP